MDTMHACGKDCADARELQPLVVVSPHYDDAVFSCGDLLAAHPGSLVVTVWAGIPDDPAVSTDWDRRCGFATAGDAMQARNAENRHALATLRANVLDLDFLDSQYGSCTGKETARLRATLAGALARLRPEAVVMPLGLFHHDHIRAADILAGLCKDFTGCRWFAYEDIPYRSYYGLLQARLAQLAQYGLTATPADIGGATGHKAAAVQAYRSQLRGLGFADVEPVLRHAERFWSLTPAAQEGRQ